MTEINKTAALPVAVTWGSINIFTRYISQPEFPKNNLLNENGNRE